MKLKGKRVLQYMKRYGVTIAEAADCLGIYPSHLRAILETDDYLDEEQAEKFIQMFGAGIANLMIDWEGMGKCKITILM